MSELCLVIFSIGLLILPINVLVLIVKAIKKATTLKKSVNAVLLNVLAVFASVFMAVIFDDGVEQSNTSTRNHDSDSIVVSSEEVVAEEDFEVALEEAEITSDSDEIEGESEEEIEEEILEEIEEEIEEEILEEIIEPQVESQPVELSKVTYQKKDDQDVQGKEAYAIGIYNHEFYYYMPSSLVLNYDEDSLFSLTVAHCDSDVESGDIVRVEGIYEFKDGFGTFSDAVITKASTTESTAFTTERNTLKSNNLNVYAADCEYGVNYESLLRGGHDWIDKDIAFEGIVSQVLYDTSIGNTVFDMFNEGTYCNIVLDTNLLSRETKNIIGVYVIPEGEARFLEGDYITMYGTFSGVEQFEMANGAPESFPVMDVKVASFTVG